MRRLILLFMLIALMTFGATFAMAVPITVDKMAAKITANTSDIEMISGAGLVSFDVGKTAALTFNPSETILLGVITQAPTTTSAFMVQRSDEEQFFRDVKPGTDAAIMKDTDDDYTVTASAQQQKIEQTAKMIMSSYEDGVVLKAPTTTSIIGTTAIAKTDEAQYDVMALKIAVDQFGVITSGMTMVKMDDAQFFKDESSVYFNSHSEEVVAGIKAESLILKTPSAGSSVKFLT